MYILTTHRKRWRIEEGREIILSGIGTASQAIAIAKRHGVVLSQVKESNYLRVA